MNPSDDPLIDARQLAELVGLRNPKSAYAWAAARGIGEVRDPARRYVRWYKADVVTWLRKHTTAPREHVPQPAAKPTKWGLDRRAS